MISENIFHTPNMIQTQRSIFLSRTCHNNLILIRININLFKFKKILSPIIQLVISGF